MIFCHPQIIHEEWRVIDKWWTDDPDITEYREITLQTGQRVVQKRKPDEEWKTRDQG